MSVSKKRHKQSAAVMSKIEKMADALDIPKEFLAGTLKITVIGNTELTAEGVLSVIEYTENRLSLSSSDYILTVEGEDFEVSLLESEYLKLCGKIRSVSYIV